MTSGEPETTGDQQDDTALAERLQAQILTNRRRWVAVYQLAAALGPASERMMHP